MKGSSAAASVLVAVGTWFVSVPPAGAAAGVVLPPGKVVGASLNTPSTAPVDGRLRGPDADGVVTAVAWPATARAGGTTAVAGAGDRLVVFSVSLAEPQEDTAGSFTPTHGTPATLSLRIAASTEAVPMTGLDDQIAKALVKTTGQASGTFAAAVPDGLAQHTSVALTQGGVTQRFDLWTLRRLPPVDSVLYRRPPDRFSIPATATGTATLAAAATLPTATGPGEVSAPVGMSVCQAGLTVAGHGENPAQADLEVELLGTDAGDTQGSPLSPWHFSFTPLPGTRLVFTPAGGHPVDATMTPDPTAACGSHDDGLFDAWYRFVVPATVTSGSLSVVPGTLSAQACEFTCQPATVDLGEGSIALGLPPLPAAHPDHQAPPPWEGAPAPPTGAAALGTATTGTAERTANAGGSSGGFPLWLALVLLALMGAVAVGSERLVRRRRRVVAPAPEAPGPEVELPTAPPARPSPEAARPLETETGDDERVPTAVPAAVAVRSVPALGADRTVESAPLGGEDDLVVRVLGPVEVRGWAAEPTERRSVVESLCCFLALHHDRARSTEELLVALDPVGSGRDVSTKTLRNNLSRLRLAVGTTRMPDAVTTGGYRIVGAVTDWDRFVELVARAKDEEGEGGDELLAEALSHVRGVPFQGAPPAPYAWALDTLLHPMTRAVCEAAHQLSQRRLAGGDPAGAEVAARLGQRACRDDVTLWADLHAAVVAGSDPGARRRLEVEATRALGPQGARSVFSGRS